MTEIKDWDEHFRTMSYIKREQNVKIPPSQLSDEDLPIYPYIEEGWDSYVWLFACYYCFDHFSITDDDWEKGFVSDEAVNVIKHIRDGCPYAPKE